MKFLSVYHSGNNQMGPAAQARMGQLVEESMKSGVLVLTGGILPVAKGGARVKATGGQVVVDGPFTETKEITGGFAILEAKSREEAIELVKNFLAIAGDGECEMHQLSLPGDPR
jgi:hypothetical protein